MKYLLDTYVFFKFINDEPHLVTPKAKIIIDGPHNELYLSAASVWEIVIKQASGKLKLATSLERFLPEQITANHLKILPINFEHILGLIKLKPHHKDPFDRMIIAQSLRENLPIVTPDKIFAKYGAKVVW